MNTHTQTTMKQASESSIHICSHCKRELPASDFYFNSKKQCYDNYCKECRKLSSRKQRENKSCLLFVNYTCHYPVITQVDDGQLRMLLILQALQKVRESMARKLKKQHEREFKEFE